MAANCFPVSFARSFRHVANWDLQCETGLAASWDVKQLHKLGEQMAVECKAKGAHVWLGPTLNIQRSPLGGRAFESFSEDPVLSGKLSAAIIRGVQGKGVAATPKHFVANDQETDRNSNSSQVSMRALREIYLKPFQILVRESDPWALMTAYNRVNGLHASETPWLLQDTLRNEWGFTGMTMSDWYGTYSILESLRAGLGALMTLPLLLPR